MNTKTKGALLASAVAGLFACASGQSQAPASGGSAAEATEAPVKCEGINECKGMGLCAAASNACAGHNDCRGKGWVKVNPAECESKGGTVAH